MQEAMVDINQIIEDLNKRIAKCNRMIEGLGNHGPFLEMLEDFKLTRQRIDDNWQLVSDEKKLQEMRITKLAIMSVINIVEDYKHDLSKAQEELVKIENPDAIIHKDYDNA
jgi:hypothetical protein